MIEPRFPWPFSRWNWLTDPVPCERLIAVRIATAVALLIDLLIGCLPSFRWLFTSEGLGGRGAYPLRFRDGTLYWSLLNWLPDSWGPPTLFAVWILAAVSLLVGYRVFLSALGCWVCAVSFWNSQPWVCNGGDQLRNALLVSAACIGLVPGPSNGTTHSQTVCSPWPLRVMFVQMACLYFFSALYKLRWTSWRDGSMMAAVNYNETWSMCPALTTFIPVWLDTFSTWLTLAWELSFPVLVCWRPTRFWVLALGVVFHVASLVLLEVGSFATYSLVYYVPFVPWERWRRKSIES